jgi:hypothetical protein
MEQITSAKVSEPPPGGWDGVDSGFGREFFYKIELANGSVYYRRFPDQKEKDSVEIEDE